MILMPTACLHLPLTTWLFIAALLPGPARAEDQAAFTIQSVNSQLHESVYFISAVFDIRLPGYIAKAVEEGFELPLAMEIEAYRRKTLWFDEQVVYIRQQFRINYHALLEEYSVLDVNAGMRNFFGSLDKALNHLTVLLDYPGLDGNTLLPDERYRVRLRFGIDGAELPLPLKSSSLWQNDWDLGSGWFEWELKR